MASQLSRKAVILALVIGNLTLLVFSVVVLSAESPAKLLFCLLLGVGVITYLYSGLSLTAGSNTNVLVRMGAGYLAWASRDGMRFLCNLTCLGLTGIGICRVGMQAPHEISVACKGVYEVQTSGFLGHEVRIPCHFRQAQVLVYHPLQSLQWVKQRVACISRLGMITPAIPGVGNLVRCLGGPTAAPLVVSRMEPTEVHSDRIQRYRLFGRGFTEQTRISLDAPSFVRGAVYGDGYRRPVAVDPNGEWADVYISVLAAGRQSLLIKVTDGHRHPAEFVAPLR